MPSATFYPSVTSQPVAGEGVLINAADAVNWTNVTTKVTQDYALTTDEGSLTSPNVNSLSPATPPTATDTRLASEFAYANIAAASISGQTKMARGVTLLRTTDNAAITSVIPATATAINSLVCNFRFCDVSYGINSTGGTGAAVYTIDTQLRNDSGAIGSLAQYTSLYDYAGITLYCYRVVSLPVFASLPTVAEVRAAGFGVNFRLGTSDVIETTPYIGLNGLTMTIAWTEAGGRVRPSRARTRLIG